METRGSIPPLFPTIALALILALAGQPLAARASGTVTDCTELSLWSALIGGGDIQLECSGTISLTEPLTIEVDTTLIGQSRDTIISAGTNLFRLFRVQPGARLTLRNLTLRDGSVAGAAARPSADGEPAYGGAIYNDGGVVTLLDATVENNGVTGGAGGPGKDGLGGATGLPGRHGGIGGGGAIYNAGGTLTASNVIFQANRATGGSGGNGGAGGQTLNGGLGGEGGNGGAGTGGVIFNTRGGLVTIFASTFSSNVVSGATGGTGGVGGGGTGLPGEPGPGGNGLGGAIYNEDGTVQIQGSAFLSNQADGASGQNGSAAARFQSEGSGGSTGGHAFGGAVYSRAGSVSVVNCTLFTNRAQGGTGGDGGDGFTEGFGGDGGDGGDGGSALGAGIYNDGGTTTVVNATVHLNLGTGGEGGEGGLAGTSVARAGVGGEIGEARGNALYNADGSLIVRNSILTSRAPAAAVAGSVSDGGFNLVSDSSLVPTATGTLLKTDPRLGTLALHGGLTPVWSLTPNSPAVDAISAIDNNSAPLNDQRDARRVRPFDIGAYEQGGIVGAVTLSITSGGNGAITVRWPVTSPTQVLESSDGISRIWNPISAGITTGNNVNVLELKPSTTQQLFRLRQQ